MSNILSMFTAAFLIVAPFIIFYLIKDKKKLYIALFFVGVAIALFLERFIPGGFTELGFLSAFSGIIVSFYLQLENKYIDDNSLNNIDNNLLNTRVVYWVSSGIFLTIGINIIFEVLEKNNWLILAVLFPIFFILSGWLAYKISEIDYCFRVFIIGIAVLSYPRINIMFSNHIYIFIHDIIHVNDNSIFLFPDHPFFDVNYYLISSKIFFDPQMTSFFILAFFIFLFLFLLFKFHWRKNLISAKTSHFEARKERSTLRRLWRIKMIAGITVLLMMSNSAFTKFESDKGVASNYFPVQSRSGDISISASKPLYQLSEGEMKKYQFNWKGKFIKFIIIRWQGKLKTVMDFCEFCKGEEEGYRLKDNHLICVVCGTPISLDTIGIPGGCNPVPLKADISKFTVRIKELDLINAFIKRRGR